ncbi:unnamed protein product [Paramecium octaurelia]|uniref:Uncharacterized protein n=1 Tax=Paramecium octaurelia TaxID=43137 RepID=A0A8S1XM87_PAROT|nr:unnamed protein product [Paramecium octaurelia]
MEEKIMKKIKCYCPDNKIETAPLGILKTSQIQLIFKFEYLNIACEVSHNKIFQNKGRKLIMFLNICRICRSCLIVNLRIMPILNNTEDVGSFQNKILLIFELVI